MNRSLLFIPALLIPTVSAAADLVSLSDSVITASRQPQLAANSPAASSVFTRADIERLQPHSVADLLRRVPGMSVTTNGGSGSLTTLSLRGTSATQSLVLVDGQRIGSASAGQPSLEFLNIENIERIEVIRGPRSAIYGSDAIGGVIQIFTRQGQSGLQPRLKLGIGSNQTYVRSLGLSAGDERTTFDIGATLAETAGIDRTRHDQEGDQDRDGYRNKAYNLGIAHWISDDLQLGLRFAEQSGTTEYDLYGNPEDEFRLSTASSYLQWQANPLWTTRLEAGHAEDKRDSQYDLASYTYNTYRDSASWLNTLTLSEAHQVQAGLDWYEDRLHSNSGFTRTERYNQAAFAQYRFSHDSLSAELGWRHDENEQFGHANTYNAALIVPVGQSQQLVASYGEGFRAPTFNDLYTTYGANPLLEPERSKSYELQWRSQLDRAELQLAAFRTDIEDMILLDPFYVAQNISRARIHGLELSVVTDVLGWETSAAAAWLDPRERGTGNLLPRRAKRTLSIDADRRFGDVGVGFSVIANSERYNDRANEQRLAGFGTLEARASWHMLPSLRWDLNVRNLLERDYSLANYSYAGRTYAYQEEQLNARLSATWTPSL